MKAVVDTNVVAYLLLGTAVFVDEARSCFEKVTTPLARPPARHDAHAYMQTATARVAVHSE
jgi:predicted nucleic acid-binding protein